MTWKKRVLIISALYILGFAIFTENQQHFFTSSYNQIRPQIVPSGGKRCLEKLALKNIQFKSLGNVGPGNCLIKDAVRIESFSSTKLSGPVTLNCTTGLSLANWLEEIEATEVEHFGSYNCRKIYETNIMSEHSFGSAVDIARIKGIRLEQNGQKTVQMEST